LETEVREFVESVTVETFGAIVGYKHGGLKLNANPPFECVFSYRVIRQPGRNTDLCHSRGRCRGKYPGPNRTSNRKLEEFT